MKKPILWDDVFTRLQERHGGSSVALFLQEQLKLAHAFASGLVSAALATDPPETAIAERAANYQVEIERGDWDGSIALAVHELGWLEGQLNWWRTMSSSDRGRVEFSRELQRRTERLRTAHNETVKAEVRREKLIKSSSRQSFTQIAFDLVEERDWGFGTGDPAIHKAIEFAGQYETRLERLKSEAGVKRRGRRT